jgi:hypothetical protein
MIEIEDAVATSIEDLDLIVDPFHKATILPCAGYLVHPSDYLGFFAEISIRGSSFSSGWARFIL